MSERVCTNFNDDDGLDIGCHLVSKEYMLEAYPELVPWMKAPALWTWGKYTGDNTIEYKMSPVQTVAAGSNWKSSTIGINHRAAIKTDGSLWLWGGGYSTNFGMLGNNSIINRSSPVQTISAGTDWKSVSAGLYHTAAIKTDGTLWSWGGGRDGQLGKNNTTCVSSPIQTISAGTNWKSVSAGAYHSVSIKIDGTLWSWGSSLNGEMGRSDAVNRSSPVQTVSAGTNWKQATTGGVSSAAIKTDGTLWVWGYGKYGQLGTNNVASRSSPVQTISVGTNWKEVSMGILRTAAIKTDGTLWLWGDNGSGALGNNTYEFGRSSPVQTVSGGTNWKSVSVKGSNGNSIGNTGAIKTDGTLWLWGQNPFGTIGDGTTITRSSPVQTISGGTGWREIQTGQYMTMAIRDEGEF